MYYQYIRSNINLHKQKIKLTFKKFFVILFFNKLKLKFIVFNLLIILIIITIIK